MLVRLPKAVPLVLTDWTTDWLLNWVRPPAALARSIWMLCESMPRPSAQRGVPPAATIEGSEAPIAIEVGLVPPNRLPTLASLPSVVKVTRPELIWPLG
jgi:hypothetical protein